MNVRTSSEMLAILSSAKTHAIDITAQVVVGYDTLSTNFLGSFCISI